MRRGLAARGLRRLHESVARGLPSAVARGAAARALLRRQLPRRPSSTPPAASASRRSSWSTAASTRRSSSPGPGAASRSGIAPPGWTTTRASRTTWPTSREPWPCWLRCRPTSPHPGPRRRADRAARPAAGRDARRLHLRRRRPRAPRGRPPRPAGTLIAIDRDPTAEERFDELAAEVACHTRFVRADFASGLEPLRAEGVPRRPRLPRPRHVLDAGRHLGARLLLRLRRPAGHAHGPRAGARRAHSSSTPGTSAGWRGVLREFGDERYAGQIARAIVRERAQAPIETTHALVEVVKARSRRPRASPAAIRPSAPSRRSASPSTRSWSSSTARCRSRGSSCAQAADLQGSPSTRSKTGA